MKFAAVSRAAFSVKRMALTRANTLALCRAAVFGGSFSVYARRTRLCEQVSKTFSKFTEDIVLSAIWEGDFPGGFCFGDYKKGAALPFLDLIQACKLLANGIRLLYCITDKIFDESSGNTG